MEKNLILFTDSGDTIIDEGTQILTREESLPEQSLSRERGRCFGS